MSDPLDFPPSRPLPEGIRDRARQHLAESMAEPGRTSRRTPLAIAAAVVLLAAAGTVITQNAGGDDGSTAAGPTTVSNVPTVRELPPPDLIEMFHARDGWAPPEAVERCAAVAEGLPAKEEWIPLMTTVVHETTLSAFRTGPDGVFFCETTRASVTVSPIVAPGTGGGPAKILFISANGSVAGFVQPQVRQLRLVPADSSTLTARGLIVGDVFLAPDTFRDVEKGVTFLVDVDQEFPVGDLPRPSAPTVDRPQPSGDRVSDAGRRLGTCLDTRPESVPDRSNWQPGVHAVLGSTSDVQLGRYGDVLAVCRGPEPGQSSNIGVHDQPDLGGKYADRQSLIGEFVWGAGFFYDFKVTPDGYASSESRGYVGLVLDDRVASITLTRDGFPDAAAVIAGGTFTLAAAATDRLVQVTPDVEVTVRDARGAVLERLSPGR